MNVASSAGEASTLTCCFDLSDICKTRLQPWNAHHPLHSRWWALAKRINWAMECNAHHGIWGWTQSQGNNTFRSTSSANWMAHTIQYRSSTQRTQKQNTPRTKRPRKLHRTSARRTEDYANKTRARRNHRLHTPRQHRWFISDHQALNSLFLSMVNYFGLTRRLLVARRMAQYLRPKIRDHLREKRSYGHPSHLVRRMVPIL